MVVGPHPLSNPANWARFSCQWLLRRTAKPSNLTGSLSEGDGQAHQKLLTSAQIRIPHLNRRARFFYYLALGRKHAFMEYHQLIRKETGDDFGRLVGVFRADPPELRDVESPQHSCGRWASSWVLGSQACSLQVSMPCLGVSRLEWCMSNPTGGDCAMTHKNQRA